MNFKKIIMVTVVFCICGSLNATAGGQGGGKHYIFNLIGSGDMELGFVPDIDGDFLEDEAFCFDVDLVNGKNRQVIGSATDCLSDIEDVGTGKTLVGTTFFHLPQGTLITRGFTTVQPVHQTTVTPWGQNITHITGASDTNNAIIGGDGRFVNATGTVRLSGMVDMTNFAGEGTPIVFDCLFVIDLD